MYKTDNRRKKNRGMYTALGIVLGIALAVGGMYVYDNYKQPILKNALQIQKVIDDRIINKPNIATINTNLQKQRQGDIDIKSLGHIIHEQINTIRVQNGLPELSYDENLGDIAEIHSLDMAKNNYLEHTSLDGKTLQDRYRMAGYVCFGWSGENIQQNYISSDNLVNSIITIWMNSPEHKDNILESSFYKEGIGIGVNSGVVYVTEDFC